jgi:hypothetical protein
MSKQSKNTSKKGKPGRKPAALKTTAPRSRRKIAPGLGADRLRNSVNVILNDESDRIARALVDKTIAGNMSGARLLVELSGAKHPPVEPEEKDKDPEDGLSLAEILMSRGQWVKKIEEFDRNPPFPGESLQSYHELCTTSRLPNPKRKTRCRSSSATRRSDHQNLRYFFRYFSNLVETLRIPNRDGGPEFAP